jgi:hypothetical protein
MAFITAVTDVQDSTGVSVVAANADGTRPPLAVRLGAGLVATFAKEGDVGIVTVATSAPAAILGKCTTVGPASATLLTAPLAASAIVALHLRVLAMLPSGYFSIMADTGYQAGGSPGAIGGPVVLTPGNFGIYPTIASAWSAGVLTVTATGATVNVTGAADNGGGKVRLSLNSGAACVDAAITGQDVTASGIGGTTEANGAHVWTFVDDHTVDLLAVNFVNAFVSPGTAVYTTPQTITWGGSLTPEVTLP